MFTLDAKNRLLRNGKKNIRIEVNGELTDRTIK